MNDITNKSREIFIEILTKYINRANKMEDCFQLETITTDMIEELREKSFFSGVNGLKYFIIKTAKDLQKSDLKCGNIELNNSRFEWIVKDVSDNMFDFDQFENDVKAAMIYMNENYE